VHSKYYKFRKTKTTYITYAFILEYDYTETGEIHDEPSGIRSSPFLPESRACAREYQLYFFSEKEIGRARQLQLQNQATARLPLPYARVDVLPFKFSPVKS